MTGKQCIFRAQGTGPGAGETGEGVFVVMPFRPNLDTFLAWSLKPFLCYELKCDERRIRRADQVSQIGYVMCESICRRIQEADLVVVDLSLDNANVFYGLGLAVGLEKRLLILCDEERYRDADHSNSYWESVGIDRDRVLRYPNVGLLELAPRRRLEDYIQTVSLPSQKAEMRILALLMPDPPGGSAVTKGTDIPGTVKNVVKSLLMPGPADDSRATHDMDIAATFESVVRAAVGVAVGEIGQSALAGEAAGKEGAQLTSAVDEELAAAVRSLGKGRTEELGRCDTRWLVSSTQGAAQKVAAYADIASSVSSSFACVVDLCQEHYLSYFWLGYCHARGINVVPVSRHTDPSQPHPVLAFDIRSLWCVQYDQRTPHRLADTLRMILAQLIVKDVPERERRIFWERLTHQNVVHIYTGAVHHREISREVVGDWDLRTVSELVRYLSSTQESVLPRFANPVYSPESIMKKLGSPLTHDEVRKDYIALATEELREHPCCLIVASADVNPFTEIVLARSYQPQFGSSWRERCFPEDKEQRSQELGNTVVALKGAGKEDDEVIRQFSWPECKDLKVNHRGFLVDGLTPPIQQEYRPQNVGGPPFNVLAHLAIVRNWFSGSSDDLIVVLNGVSGPGTSGLAEVLTGADTTQKNEDSERILKDLNGFWEQHCHEPSFGGIEAFIAVCIDPGGAKASSQSEGFADPTMPAHTEPRAAGEVKALFEDNRHVVSWKLCEASEIKIGNPRVIRTYPEPQPGG